MLVQAENLTHRYPRKNGAVTALDDVGLTVEKGQFLAIKGVSGSGKSTLLLVVAGLLTPNAGEVQIDGVSVYGLSPAERARLRATRIGMVFQQFHLVPYLTVLGNVLLPDVAAKTEGAEARARELIDQLGLGTRSDHVPADLSTGERQRVALARALLHRPSLLLADEPTGNLDEASGRIVLDHLRRFTQAGGAVLLVTHDPQAASAADAVLQMEAGRLSASVG